jgi:hypothetical protein
VSVFVESHFDDEEGITTPVLDMLLNDPMLKVTKREEEDKKKIMKLEGHQSKRSLFLGLGIALHITFRRIL